MYDDRSKARVLEVFLGFVEGYQQLKEAVLATLGGAGLEARLWLSRGIPGDHGWLIERGRRESNALIRARFPYSYTAQLSTFARVLRAIHGMDAAVDGFHLDLCGTIEPNLAEFQSVMPIIVGSRGRALAITVAEQRGNRSLRDHVKIEVWGRRLLGHELYAQFIAQLEAEQTAVPRGNHTRFPSADPVKGAQREFGFFLHFLTLIGMAGKQLVALPDRIERFVYVSRSSGYSFRMRTYLFHLEPIRNTGEWKSPKIRAQALLVLWRDSKLVFIDSTGILQTVHKAPLKKKEERVMVPELGRELEQGVPSALTRLVQAVGGEVLEEFQRLCTAAQIDRAGIEQRVSELETKLRESETKLEAVRHALNGANTNTPTAVIAANATQAKRGPGRPRKNATATAAEPIGKADHFSVQFDLLRAAAKGKSEFEKAYREAMKCLGLSRNKKRRFIMAALWSRAKGGFRGDFIMRVLRGKSEVEQTALYEELAELYSRIEGKTVLVSMLHKDVRAAARKARVQAKRLAEMLHKRHAKA